MRLIIMLGHIFWIIMLSGCAQFSGPYYLNHGEFEDGIRVLSEELSEDPEDSTAAYYLGRYYLALDEPEQASTLLQKAARLDPDNSEYRFWVGVAYWALDDFKEEQSSYRQALSIDEDNISANLYLAHSYLDEGKFVEALGLYDKVLVMDKYNPQALYNRADILTRQGLHEQARKEWKKFLEYYPDGSLAVYGTEQLNHLGDFSYRNFILGKRNVTLRAIRFKSGTVKSDLESSLSLRVLAAIMKADKENAFHIVAYCKGNSELAKARAKHIRNHILNAHPGIDAGRLPLSWFGVEEKIRRGDRTFKLNDSIRFITVLKKEES
ncbi:tetratricopeptide repeat protein [Maridesulfovibrio salexigens]|uniref:Tetratricopeptide TPR_2 repeat protein n=1 Tax=Maridesulfovibrio salexigens (strain ATCC 14822 / DSM 2638 / NCIMB 8403 / VKM B-1763) TaxID=526222 RepID=C6C1Q1_MARSD|nr:tetratricopeptide repeat protein [Maridesulfovibrio salexigens]ACS79297.1 Tetratricopeptide TPR_2 repeat protein [Maridesulfovibrio salexigens DSM 2638]